MRLSVVALVCLLLGPCSAMMAFNLGVQRERTAGAKMAKLFAPDSDLSSGEGSSSSSSSSASDSSYSSSEDEADSAEESGERLLENMAGWMPNKRNACGGGKFSEGGKCRRCTVCGPDLYEREKCSAHKDTVCEWCLSGANGEQNEDFRAKCEQLVALRDEFRSALKKHGGRPIGLPKPAIYTTVSVQSASEWWKAELAVEMAFYLALIGLVLAVIRFLAKSRPHTYRTVTVSPPVLEDWEQKNIVRAAESIKDKLGNKGYAKLEEEFL